MAYKVTKWNSFTFRVKQKVKRMKYTLSRITEKILRKVLFIGDIDQFSYFEKVDDGPYKMIDGEKLEAALVNSHIRFHGKPRREQYMDVALRFMFYTWYEPFFTFKRWVRNKVEWFLFFRAREIAWKTHHYIHRKGTGHIDGYFEYKVWGIKCGRTFDLCSVSCIKHDALEWDFVTKKNKKVLNYLNLNDYGSWGFPTLLVLKDKIMPKDIDKILNKWYDDQVEWKYRHWTWEGDRPKIIVDDLKFMEDPCEKCGLDAYNCQGHYGENKDAT